MSMLHLESQHETKKQLKFIVQQGVLCDKVSTNLFDSEYQTQLNDILALAQKKRCKSSQIAATPQPSQPPTTSIRAVTMPIRLAAVTPEHAATTCAITMPVYDITDQNTNLVTGTCENFDELPSVSLHQSLTPSQISTFNTLSLALQPDARIIDYSLTSVPSLPLINVDEAKLHISTYSSLAGALGEVQAS
jgi:hypothetical protein